MHIHKQEKQQFKKLFKQENINRFEDRFKILETFLQTEQHVTITDLQHLLHQNGHRFKIDFIEDTLDLMCYFGFAKSNRFDNGQVRYEHLHLGQHHDHMICTKCKNIVEFQNQKVENLQSKIAAEHGFFMLQHKMELYGICANCLKERAPYIPLVMAKPGEQLLIKEFTGGSGARMHLLTMGLRIGDTVEIITNQNKGQVVIAVDYNRYVLGRGLAEKILVEHLPQ